MTQEAFDAVCRYRDDIKSLCVSYDGIKAELESLVGQINEEYNAKNNVNIVYPLENLVVYNTAYDDIKQDDLISLIVVGDNPGQKEQLNENRKYLVGQSGKIAQGFFAKNAELGIDFRKNTLITNKTVIHTAKTVQLKLLAKKGSSCVQEAIKESQVKMARLTATLHQSLCKSGQECRLWLVGYSELKAKGIFSLYREQLKSSYSEDKDAWEKVFVYQHFSMNRFLVDLKSYQKDNPQSKLQNLLDGLGTLRKKEIF